MKQRLIEMSNRARDHLVSFFSRFHKEYEWAHDKFDELNSDFKKNDYESRIHILMFFGNICMAAFFMILLLFGFFAQIEISTLAPGKIVLEGKPKLIEHLEGGRILKINVKDGDFVKKGEVLLELDKESIQARIRLLKYKYFETLAKIIRLKAEKIGEPVLFTPDQFDSSLGQDKIDSIISSEKEIHDSNQGTLSSQEAILNDRIGQLEIQVKSYEEQIKSIQEQKYWVDKELEAFKKLDEKRIIEKTRLWDVQRKNAILDGDLKVTETKIAEIREAIGETKQQIISLKSGYQNNVLNQLGEAQKTLDEVKEQLKSAEYASEHTAIISPVSGVIMNLAESTEGGVVNPGGTIMEIVPQDDKLVVSAQVNPMDIDAVSPGMPARVKLAAFKQNKTPSVEGSVISVSPDIVFDSSLNQSYYLAKVMISAEQLPEALRQKLYPGMPVQVMIVSGEQSPLNYLLSPFFDSFDNAFHEQ